MPCSGPAEEPLGAAPERCAGTKKEACASSFYAIYAIYAIYAEQAASAEISGTPGLPSGYRRNRS